jgi:hypothetical protein
MRDLGKVLQAIDPVVVVCITVVTLIILMRFLPLDPVYSSGLGDQDKDRLTLVRLYYTYWNDESIHKLIRLNADQTQAQIVIAVSEPVEIPIAPDLYREHEEKSRPTWTAYKDYTTVTPFNKNIDPFQIDRTWHSVIDGDPPELCII